MTDKQKFITDEEYQQAILRTSQIMAGARVIHGDRQYDLLKAEVLRSILKELRWEKQNKKDSVTTLLG